jgi:hypothetical protein
MRRRIAWIATTVVLVTGVVAATGVAGANGTDVHQARAGSPGSFAVVGNVKHRLVLNSAVLALLPQHEETLTFLAGSTPETHTFKGPLLSDVLNLAGPKFDPAVKNDKLRHYVTATGSDGYQALVAYGELDPDFGGKEILLAHTQDGQSLADLGPRLVVPGDKRGGRYVSNVVRVRLDRGR